MTEQSHLPAEVAEPNGPAIRNTKTTQGGPIAALVPESLDDVFRIAKALALSGDMVPRNFQNKPEAIAAAIMRGMEIGMAPTQALDSIAVINGKATLFGDALPALMQRAGHHIDHELTGEGDDMTATATLVRGDTGQQIVRTFSVDDAKKAGLWGKTGPWSQYSKRMLAMRARTLACRDGAADALKGMQVAEEVSDYAPMRDVTPKAASGGFGRLAARAKGQEVPEGDQEPSQEPENAPEPPMDADEARTPFQHGQAAAAEGLTKEACPYGDDIDKATEWLDGFESVEGEIGGGDHE